MIAALFLGGAAGLGVLIVGRAFRRRPPGLATVLRRIDAPHLGSSVRSGAAPARASSRVSRRIGWVAGSVSGRVERDLRAVGRSAERHALDKLALAAILGALVPMAVWVISSVGGGIPGVIAPLFSVVGLAGGYVLPDLLLRTQAEQRRRQFRFSLSSYLDLVNVLLAGGAGVETALEATAEAGDGWAFAELRTALTRSRATRRSPWAALAELGEQLAVDELVELAASIQLAGVEGARIRASLAAKAAALRGRQLAQIEADAHAASERMGVPTVAMFAAFLALLAYPAVQQIAGA